MLDQRFVRANLDIVRKAVTDKKERVDLDRYVTQDERRRALLQRVEALRQRRNAVSEDIARRKRNGREATEQIAAMREVSRRIKRLDRALAALEADIESILVRIPNIPHASVPVGPDASASVEVRRWGTTPEAAFERRPHWDIGERLDILDTRRPGKIAGHNFLLLKGAGARLERALVQFMLDLHVREHGYTEVSTPYLVNRSSLFGTGQLPKMEDEMYRTEGGDLFLVPTAEVPVTNIHRDEVLPEEDLPIRYTAYSPCFRREAGAYGRETRGLIRVHQFGKVELVGFAGPETSWGELEKLTRDAEAVLQRLNLPYRVMNLSTGALSFAAAKCYDLEVWAPGVARWLEVSSCSHFRDFQARRAGIRYRTTAGKTRFVHTLNGSGLALPRTMIALLEQYQTADGAVRVPEALRPYMGGMETIEPRPGRGPGR